MQPQISRLISYFPNFIFGTWISEAGRGGVAGACPAVGRPGACAISVAAPLTPAARAAVECKKLRLVSDISVPPA
ncbi:hypothetical protein SBA4_1380009 [Candidatus Sulfopaludibacter sp. SbA4]|nr:hypothetical protein SBA4_1380009 [Candidatus Sulfopaludibacter sp. SbA4]